MLFYCFQFDFCKRGEQHTHKQMGSTQYYTITNVLLIHVESSTQEHKSDTYVKTHTQTHTRIDTSVALALWKIHA